MPAYGLDGGVAGPLERDGRLAEFSAGVGGGGLGESVQDLPCRGDVGCCCAVVGVDGQQESCATPGHLSGLLRPLARQVVRIPRKRRRIGAKKWQTETAYAVTDLSAERATHRRSTSLDTRAPDHGEHRPLDAR